MLTFKKFMIGLLPILGLGINLYSINCGVVPGARCSSSDSALAYQLFDQTGVRCFQRLGDHCRQWDGETHAFLDDEGGQSCSMTFESTEDGLTLVKFSYADEDIFQLSSVSHSCNQTQWQDSQTAELRVVLSDTPCGAEQEL